MIEKIFMGLIMFLGIFTFTVLLLAIVINMVEAIHIKIKNGKDVGLNIKHINSLIYRINKEGKQVRAKGKYLVLDDIVEVEISDKKVD